MGLDIIGSKTDKEYHMGYSAIHLVRYLALLDCGWPEDIDGWPGFYVLPQNLDAAKFRQIVTALQMAGHIYPNLLLHSDAEGTYTKTGKVCLDECKDAWMTGNSLGLLRELEDLEANTSADRREKYPRAWEVFGALFSLVKDEIRNGGGHLKFT